MSHPENNPDYVGLTDRQKWQLAELKSVNRGLNAEQAALERLQHDDPVGLCWFGQSEDTAQADAWLASRMYGKQPK